MPNHIIYQEISGWPTNLRVELNNKIMEISKSHKKVKVGRTYDPEQRFIIYKANGNWDRLFVIYKTSSKKNCKAVESYLAEYTSADDVCSKGNWADNPPYYVYVVAEELSSFGELATEVKKIIVKKTTRGKD